MLSRDLKNYFLFLAKFLTLWIVSFLIIFSFWPGWLQTTFSKSCSPLAFCGPDEVNVGEKMVFFAGARDISANLSNAWSSQYGIYSTYSNGTVRYMYSSKARPPSLEAPHGASTIKYLKFKRYQAMTLGIPIGFLLAVGILLKGHYLRRGKNS